MSDDALTCYTISGDVVSSTNQYVPCGPSITSGGTAQSCCAADDYCMQDGICHYTRLGVVNGTGYYMAGCTDSGWSDPACPRQCSEEYTSDIIYNREESYWNCCKSEEGYLNCQEPSNFVVRAPAPQLLETVTQIASTVPSSTAVSEVGEVTISHSVVATSSAVISNVPARPTSTQGSGSASAVPNPAQLSTGAIAGIAIAVIVGVLAIFGGVFLFYRQSKRRHESFKHFNDADSHYSTRNRSHATSIRSLTATSFTSSTRDATNTNRNTYASAMTATTAATRATRTTHRTNRDTYATARSATSNTNRNTYASTAHTTTEGPTSPRLPQSPRSGIPSLPAGADGIQVVKQLPRTPEEIAIDHGNEKILLSPPSQTASGKPIEYGPFEMHAEEFEMQLRNSQQRPVSMQELEGTTVAFAELEGEAKRRSERETLVLGSIHGGGDEEDEDEDEDEYEDVDSRPASVHEAVPGIVVGGRRDET